MINGLHLYSAFLVFRPLKALLHYVSYLPIPTHSYAEWYRLCHGVQWYHARSQPAHQRKLTIHTHSHTDDTAIRNNLGFSILPKDTLTCGLKEPGIEPLIFWSVDDLLYLLSHSRLSFDMNYSQVSISHFHVVYSLRPRCVKAFRLECVEHFVIWVCCVQ